MEEMNLNVQLQEMQRQKELMKDLDFSIRWTMMKAEAHYEFVKNSQGDEYDYIDLKGINDILTPLRLKYFILINSQSSVRRIKTDRMLTSQQFI